MGEPQKNSGKKTQYELQNNDGKTLTEQQKNVKIQQIEADNNQIISQIKKIERSEQDLNGRKVDLIRTLAENYERLHQLGVYKKSVDSICATICELAVKEELVASESYIHSVLDVRYKQQQFAPKQDGLPPDLMQDVPEYANAQTEEQTEQMRQNYDKITSNVPNPSEVWSYSVSNNYSVPEYATTSSSTTGPLWAQPSQSSSSVLNKPIDEMNDEELRKYAESIIPKAKQTQKENRVLRRQVDYVLEEVDKRKVAIDPEIRGIIKPDVKSATPQASGPSLFSESLKELSDIIYRAAEKVEKYKPDPETDKILAEAIQTEIKLWTPWLDEKYRKDTPSWLQVMIADAAHGRHAAASKHPTLLPDKTTRLLTREQVGDKEERMYELSHAISVLPERWAAMHRWHVSQVEPAIAKRAVDLHDVLSESA